MPIKRSSAQRSKTLEEFYGELVSMGDGSFEYLVGKDMLKLLEFINNTFQSTQLWGMTSHYRLVIQNADFDSNNFDPIQCPVIVSALAGEYNFEYKMPSTIAPWENAAVRGTAKSIVDMKRYLLIAMNESEAWNGNHELEMSLSQICNQ